MPDLLDREQQLETWKPEKDLKGMGGVFRSFNLAMYSYAHHRPIVTIDPTGTDAVGAGITLNAPSWLGKLIFGEDFIGQGGAAGVAISYPGLFGGEYDLGVYVEVHGGGTDYGTGRGTVDLTYNAGSVKDLGGVGAEISFNDGIGGLSVSMDEKGNLSGVGMHLGPGINVGGAGTIGTTYTVRDAIKDVKSWFSSEQ